MQRDLATAAGLLAMTTQLYSTANSTLKSCETHLHQPSRNYKK